MLRVKEIIPEFQSPGQHLAHDYFQPLQRKAIEELGVSTRISVFFDCFVERAFFDTSGGFLIVSELLKAEDWECTRESIGINVWEKGDSKLIETTDDYSDSKVVDWTLECHLLPQEAQSLAQKMAEAKYLQLFSVKDQSIFLSASQEDVVNFYLAHAKEILDWTALQQEADAHPSYEYSRRFAELHHLRFDAFGVEQMELRYTPEFEAYSQVIHDYILGKMEYNGFSSLEILGIQDKGFIEADVVHQTARNHMNPDYGNYSTLSDYLVRQFGEDIRQGHTVSLSHELRKPCLKAIVRNEKSADTFYFIPKSWVTDAFFDKRFHAAILRLMDSDKSVFEFLRKSGAIQSSGDPKFYGIVDGIYTYTHLYEPNAYPKLSQQIASLSLSMFEEADTAELRKKPDGEIAKVFERLTHNILSVIPVRRKNDLSNGICNVLRNGSYEDYHRIFEPFLQRNQAVIRELQDYGHGKISSLQQIAQTYDDA